jgi:hypothetical protein
MTDSRGNRVRRILDAKRQQPEYQRLDTDVKEGGKSLLHDEFGLPKVASSAHKGDIPIMKDVSNEPIQVKASEPDVNRIHIARRIPQRGNPLPQDDDGFLPPKNNFVAVGQVDSAWNVKEVTGLPDKMVDNNWPADSSDDEGDIVEQKIQDLQGIDPLGIVNDQKVTSTHKIFEDRLNHILAEVSQKLYEINSIDEFNDFKVNVLGQNGPLQSVLQQFAQLPQSERPVIGQLVNDVIDQLKLAFEEKEYDLSSFDEDIIQPTDDELEDYNQSEDDITEEEVVTTKISTALEENHYAILVNDQLFAIAENQERARNILSNLILGKDIPVDDIQLIKRIPIDFGIILKE